MTIQLPCDIQAEKSLLGALMMDSKYVNQCADIVAPADFSEKKHRIIFDHICRMTYEHEPIDIVTLTNRIVSAKQIEDVGGRVYLVELPDSVNSPANASRYAEIIKEKANLRALHKAASEVCSRVLRQDNPNDIATKMMAQSLAIGNEAGIRSVLLSDRAVEILKPAEGLPTGYRALDNAIVCLENACYYVVAGFTGMGKSTFVTGIAINATEQAGVRAVIANYEMGPKQQGHRVMAAKTGIDMQRIRRWEESLTPEEMEKCEMALARDRIEYIFDTHMKPMQLYRFLAREVPLGVRLLVVDYIQLMEPDRAFQSRELEVSSISRFLKTCALDFNIPVIGISQFAEPRDEPGTKKTGEKKAPVPHMGLLRESKKIGHDADVVIFVHRKDALEGQWIIAKNRQGPKTIIKTTFRPDTATFEEA